MVPREVQRTAEEKRLVAEIDSDADFYFIAGYTPDAETRTTAISEVT